MFRSVRRTPRKLRSGAAGSAHCPFTTRTLTPRSIAQRASSKLRSQRAGSVVLTSTPVLCQFSIVRSVRSACSIASESQCSGTPAARDATPNWANRPASKFSAGNLIDTVPRMPICCCAAIAARYSRATSAGRSRVGVPISQRAITPGLGQSGLHGQRVAQRFTGQVRPRRAPQQRRRRARCHAPQQRSRRRRRAVIDER